MAASCPECVGRLQRVELYNEARVPRRYLHSRLQATDQDKHNAQIFSLLDAIHRNLPDYLRTHQEQGSTTDDLKGMVLMGPPGTGRHICSAALCISVRLPMGFPAYSKALRNYFLNSDKAIPMASRTWKS